MCSKSDHTYDCFKDFKHTFIFSNKNSWWLIIKYDSLIEYRLEIHNSLPTFYVFANPPFSIVFEYVIHEPVIAANAKSIIEKYINHYNKMKAFI